MTPTEQVLALAMLEQDGEPKIPGLRITVADTPSGSSWVPIDPKDATWAIARHYDAFLINSAGAWVWPEIGSNGYYGVGEYPWGSLIDAAYKAEIGDS
jgi:hypothetical protein